MPLVAAYYRPDSLQEALSLLAQSNRIPLAGGTVVNADREATGVEVVDLQALDLNHIEADGNRVRIGATTTLAAMADHAAIAAWLQIISRAEAPSTLRTLATVGGTIVGASNESLLLAALLVCDAVVEVTGPNSPATVEIRPLADVLSAGMDAGALLTAVTVDVSGHGGQAITGRTPADVPIVGAVARIGSEGETTLALTGVAATPILIDPSDPGAGLSPPADFRGSSEYRLHLARILSARAVKRARAGAEDRT